MPGAAGGEGGHGAAKPDSVIHGAAFLKWFRVRPAVLGVCLGVPRSLDAPRICLR
jgi:hypothetical protein